MSTFYIIEGATCSGKTTLTRSIQVNYSGHVILEHPPLSKGQAPDLASYYEHQLNVFESFMVYYDGAPFGLWYVDYSPFGCIPFTRALVRTGIDACAPLIPYFIRRCNELCKRHELYLYQYMSVEYHIMRQRLIHRKRKGDDTWSEELLRALCEEYDEFFQNGGLLLGAGNRITGVHDPYAVTTKRTDLIPKQPYLWAVYPPPPPPPPEPEDDYKPLPIEDEMYTLKQNGTKIELLDDDTVVSTIDIADIVNSMIAPIGLDSHELIRVGNTLSLAKDGVPYSSVNLDRYALSRVDDQLRLSVNGTPQDTANLDTYTLSRVADRISLARNGVESSSAGLDAYTLSRVDANVRLEKNGTVDSSIGLDSYSLARNNSSIRLMKDDVEDSSVDVAYIIADALADSVTTNRVDLTYDPVSIERTISSTGVHGEPRIIDRGEARAPIIVLDAGDVVLVRGSRTLQELMGTTIIHVGDKFTITDPAPSVGIYLAASKDGGFVEPTTVDSRSKVFLGAGTYMALSSADITNKDTVVLVKKLG